MSMNLVHLETFLKVATVRSFTRAAQELFVTQPTVTHRIHALEGALGYQLFVRSSTNIRLTAKGRQLHKKTAELFRLIHELEGAVREPKKQIDGTLNIAASSVMSAYFLPARLQILMTSYPDIDIRVHFGTAYSIAHWVQDAFVDIGFAPRSPGFEKLKFTPLLVEPCVVATSAAQCARWGDSASADILAGQRFILREKGTKAHDVAMKWLKRQPWFASLRPPVIFSNMESIKNLIISGAGVTILPRCCVQPECGQGLMQVIATETPIENITYCMIERVNESYDDPATIFREILARPRL